MGVKMMRNTLKIALASGALLAAAAIPASAQGFGFGFSTGNGYDRYSGYYSDYGRGYGDRYGYSTYNRPYYGGNGWRHHRDWDDDWRWRRHHWRHGWN